MYGIILDKGGGKMIATALKPKERYLLFLIKELAGKEIEITISKEELQKITGYKCKHTVRFGMEALQEKGYISIERQSDRNGYHLANKYILTDKAIEIDINPAV